MSQKADYFKSALADQGGIAIENAHLFERINNNALLFRNLAAKITASLDINKIMHSLTGETGTALGMKGGPSGCATKIPASWTWWTRTGSATPFSTRAGVRGKKHYRSVERPNRNHRKCGQR